jgi:hypothetical protein
MSVQVVEGRMEAGDRGTGSRRIETCKLNAVDPPAYLVDILTRLVNLWAASRIDELLPWNWPRTATA